MKSLLVLISVVGVAVAQHWGAPGPSGVPADTPEVAAAKAAHLAALARANQAPQQQSWNQPQQQSWNQPQQQWAPPQQQWNQPQQSRWNGPIALPPGFDQNGAPLPVQDTPEVAAERSRHFNLYSSGGHPSLAPAQPQWNAPAPQQQWNSPAPQQQQWNSPAPQQQQWNSPAPQQQWGAPAPQWNAPSQPGLPQDTPEVAAAKAAHLAVHASLPPSNNQGRWKRSILTVPAVSSISAYSTSIVHSAAPVVSTAHVVAAPAPAHIYAAPARILAPAPILTTRLLAGPALHAAPLALSHW